jgi:isoleucyl-tRNA synthetase
VAAAVAALDGAEVDRLLKAGESVPVVVGEGPHELGGDDLLVETEQREGFVIEREGDLVVALSTELTPELRREGLARELVHHVQNTRKAAGLQIEDRIHLALEGPEEIEAMLEEFGEWVQKETLSVTLGLVPGTPAPETVGSGAADGDTRDGYSERLVVNGLSVTITVRRAAG